MIHEPVSVSARASRVLTAACVAMSVLLGAATSLYATNPDRWHMLMLPALGLFGVALAAWAYAHHVTRSIGQWISTNRSRAIMVAVVFSASLLGWMSGCSVTVPTGSGRCSWSMACWRCCCACPFLLPLRMTRIRERREKR
ncbi:hypothetical protein RAA17_12470 [Komagataeibacter rhaeticus]|nr:hypothetical protein [Komagataeibacter rhaeticus]